MKKLSANEDVYDLLKAPAETAALRAAIYTGLLWMVAEHPMDAANIVQALNIPGKRGYYWLQFLQAMGVLEKTDQGFIPSPVIRAAVLQTRSKVCWQHVVLDEAEKDACVHGLFENISVSGSLWASQGLAEPESYVDKMRESLDRAREFDRTLFELHQNLAKDVANLLDLTGIKRIMDLGGGSGVISMALLRRYPSLTSTVVDIENVCIAGREIAEEDGLSDRIGYHPAEFESDDFPGGFDLVLQCDVAVHNKKLYEKVWRTLNPGGRLVLVEHIAADEYSAPVTRLEWTFLDSLRDPDFAHLTLSQIETMLFEAGFQVSPETHTLGRGWVVIQAFKNEILPGQFENKVQETAEPV